MAIKLFLFYTEPLITFLKTKELFNKEFNIYLKDKYKSQTNSIICASDCNIDFLKYAEHTPTTEFIDVLFNCKIFPFIYRPTCISNASATLIDYIHVTIH